MFTKIFIIFIAFLPVVSFAEPEVSPDNDIYHEKGIVRQVKNQETQNPDGIIQQTQVEILAGKHQGETVEITNSFSGKLRELLVEKGDKVLLYVEDHGDQINFSIRDFWRFDSVIFWILFFIVLTWIIVRNKGLKGILALGLSILIIFYIFLPAVSNGADPILYTLLISVFIILINVPLIHGWNRKSLIISLSTTIAIIFTIIITLAIDHFLQIKGNGAEETAYLQKGLQAYYSLPKIFAAGVILGALGAVMDVCVSIASGLYEIVQHQEKTSFQKLWHSGINIGSDVLGSMLNTIIFAYVGASLIMLIVLTQGDVKLLPLLNFSFIIEEIVRSLIGAFGLLLAIPITSALASWLLNRASIKTSPA